MESERNLFPTILYDFLLAAEKISFFYYFKKKLTNIFKDNPILQSFLVLVIPFAVVFINGIFMWWGNALLPNDEIVYSYIEDISNSVILTFLSFYSYYLCGHFCKKVHGILNTSFVDSSTSNQIDCNNGRKFILFIMNIIISFFFVWYFGHLNLSTGRSRIWYQELPTVGKCFYLINLGFTIYNSLCLMEIVILTNAILCVGIKNKLIIIPEFGQIWNIHFRKIGNILLYSLYYVLFYVISLAVIVFNGIVHPDYFSVNLLSTECGSILILFVGGSFVASGIIVIFLTLYLFYSYAYSIKMEMIDQCDKNMLKSRNETEWITYRESLIKQNIIHSSAGNKLIGLFSVLVPLCSLILEIVLAYLKNG